MSYKIILSPEAEEDLQRHARLGNKPVLKKISTLIHELEEHPTTGTGKLEPLKGDRKGQFYISLNHGYCISKKIYVHLYMQNLKNKKAEEPDTKFVSESWIKDFLSIPAEYRVNPFDVSPSGDLFFADKRNLEHIDNARKGKIKKLSREEQAALFR